MEFILVWLLFGIASAMVAGRKGRSGIGWFLLGTLLGPFALPFAFLSSDLTKNSTEAAEASSSKSCPHCAERIKIEAKVCRFCGRDIPSLAQPSLSEDEQFDAWLRAQQPPILDPTPAQRAEYRQAWDYMRSGNS